MSDIPPPPPPPPPGQQPPPPPPSGGYQAGPQPVGPWPRFGARFIDALVLLVPSFVIVLLVGGGGSGTPFSGEADISGVVAGVVATLVEFAYFVWLEATRGQTLGKMALGYRVVGPGGGLPTTEEAVRRNAWLLLAVVPVLGDLAQLVISIVIGVTISSDPFKRGWHDNFAGGTAVVRTR